MKKEKNFEEALHELENIVQQLERGELPLDESLDVFQRGIELSKFCSKRLDQIEKKISVLVESKDGSVTEEDFKLEV